jgi:hypothetical protein
MLRVTPMGGIYVNQTFLGRAQYEKSLQSSNEQKDPSHDRRAACHAQSHQNIYLLTEALKYYSEGYTLGDIIGIAIFSGPG